MTQKAIVDGSRRGDAPPFPTFAYTSSSSRAGQRQQEREDEPEASSSRRPTTNTQNQPFRNGAENEDDSDRDASDRPPTPPPQATSTNPLRTSDRRHYRPIQSCTECRRRKTKCNKVFPCEPCIARGPSVAGACIEYHKERPKGYVGYAHLADFDMLVQRTKWLEGLVMGMREKLDDLTASGARRLVETEVDGALHGSGFEDDGEQRTKDANAADKENARDNRSMIIDLGQFPLPSAMPSTSISGPSTGKAPKPSFYHSRSPSKAPSLVDHNAALVLEDLALDRDRNLERETMPEIGAQRNNGSDAGPSTGRSATVGGSRSAMARAQPTVSVPDLHTLPGRETTTTLINMFISRHEWTFRVLHIPTFRDDVAAFLSSPLINPLSITEAARVALVAACLAATLHVADDPIELQGLGHATEESRAAEVKRLSDLMEMTMFRSDWMQHHRIEWLQAYIIIGPYWHASGRSEAHWAMLGSAIKVAHNLGLSHLSIEKPEGMPAEEVRRYHGQRWRLAADREIGRRVWYTLVDLDWSTCPEHHFTYITPASLHNAEEPANIDDDDLEGSGPVKGRPKDVHTSMSFYLARLALVHPLQRMIEKVIQRVGMTYDLVKECHRDTMQAIESWPSFYRAEDDSFDSMTVDAATFTRIMAERRLLRLLASRALLRLHRPYLPTALVSSSSRYSLSRDVSLMEASNIVLGDDSSSYLVSRRTWAWRYGILSATIVLLCIYFHAKDATETALIEGFIRQGLQALRSQEDSAGLSRLADSIESLLREELAWRKDPGASTSSNGRKRSRGKDDSDAHRLVKRVMFSEAHRKSSHVDPLASQDPGSSEQFSILETPPLDEGDGIDPFHHLTADPGGDFTETDMGPGWDDPWLIEMLRGSFPG